jgi:hypothetical protein
VAFVRQNMTSSMLSSPAMNTSPTGSMLLVCIGRGNVSMHEAPTDNKGNTFAQAGSTHVYTLWPSSGTALYSCSTANGGAGHVVRTGRQSTVDETTMSVVEVSPGGRLQDVQWREALAGGGPITSASVTTTGPALLVAWWWGDADVNFDKTAVPNNGFAVIHSVLASGELVQCAVATRQVDAAGTYNVTWTATPTQGAQLWIAAIQATP